MQLKPTDASPLLLFKIDKRMSLLPSHRHLFCASRRIRFNFVAYVWQRPTLTR